MPISEVVFNLASAALNLRDSGKTISFASYALAVTYLAISIFGIVLAGLGIIAIRKITRGFIVFPKESDILDLPSKKPQNININIKPLTKPQMIYQIINFLAIIVNIAYCALVIQYYNSQTVINDQFYNLSLAIVVIDSASLLS